MERLQKTTGRIVTQTHKTVHCDVLTENVHRVESSKGHNDKNFQTVQCEKRKGSGETLENRGGHSDREKNSRYIVRY